MRTLVALLLICSIWLLSSLIMISTSFYANATNLINQKALDIVADFADRTCKNVSLDGNEQSVKLSIELNRIIKKFVELGLEGVVQYDSSEYKGLLQKDLIEALKTSTACKLEIIRILKDGLLIHIEQSQPIEIPNTPSVSDNDNLRKEIYGSGDCFDYDPSMGTKKATLARGGAICVATIPEITIVHTNGCSFVSFSGRATNGSRDNVRTGETYTFSTGKNKINLVLGCRKESNGYVYPVHLYSAD